MIANAQNPVAGITPETRALFRVVILSFISAAAIASRLFSVIRKYRREAHGWVFPPRDDC